MNRLCTFVVLTVLSFASLPAHGAAMLMDEQLIPRSVDFLPPPPAEDSIDMERDKAIYQQTRSEIGTDRWKLAAHDAEMERKSVEGTWFAEAFGIELNKRTTPATCALVGELFEELGKSASSAKDHYMRVRPFVYYDAPGSTCAPADEKFLSTNGSYPSGHAARGWGLALLLAELSPERQSALLKRGYEFGQSRVICGVHWQSDVDAARMLAGATVVQMYNSPAVVEMIDKAKKEIRLIRQDGKLPTKRPDN